MSLGLVASAASILRLVYTTKYVSQSDPLYGIIVPAIWGSEEEYIGLIAACVPFLRVPFEKMLDKVGLLSSFHGGTSERNGYNLTPLGSDGVRIKNREIITPASPHYGSGRSTEVLYSYKT
jgi:hypothetical protein